MIERRERDVRRALLVGIADDEARTVAAYLFGVLLVPLVVIEPAHRAGTLGEALELAGDVVEVVGDEIADEHARAGVEMIGHPVDGVTEVVRTGRDERRRAERLSNQGDAGQPVGIGIGDHDSLRAGDGLARLAVGPLLVERIGIEKARTRQQRLPGQREVIVVDESVVHAPPTLPRPKYSPLHAASSLSWRTVSTGTERFLTSASATLPRTNRYSPCRPRVPVATRSAS